MGDVIRFPNPGTAKLTPWWCEGWEIDCIIMPDYFEREVPRFSELSVFENRWLNNLRGYRHCEVDCYLESVRDFYDARITKRLYGIAELPQNIRWESA